MRVLILTHNYPRFPYDPAGAYVARLAAATAGAGNAVMVLAPHAKGLELRETQDDVTLVRFRYAPDAWEVAAYRGDLHTTPLLSARAMLAVPAFLASFARAARRAVAEFRPDLIHAHWWLPGGWMARLAGGDAPFGVTCHGSDVRLLERRAFRRLAAPVFAGATFVTTVSRFLADDVERCFPALAGRVQVTPMPVEIAMFEQGLNVPKADPPIVLYAGNLLESKGVDDLVVAFAELRRTTPCRLKIVGQGPAESALRERVRSLDLGTSVVITPFVTQREMPGEYGAATVTVLPTRGNVEGLGLTLVEALLAGSAVVGTRAGGIPEVVRDGETGLLARGGDPRDLARQIGRLLRDAPLRARLAAGGRAWAAERFAPADAARRFQALYEAARAQAPR